jgi:hypothetical protein
MPVDRFALFLFSRRVSAPAAAALALTLIVGCVLLFSLEGCLSISVDSRKDNSVLEQEGELEVPHESSRDVYYPQPFQCNPNLEVTTQGSLDTCEVIVQEPDHFRIKNIRLFSAKVKWKARGLKAGSLPVVHPPDPAPPVPSAPELPPRPVPIDPANTNR